MCVCAVVGGVGCDGVAVERAENLTSEKYPGGCKADVTVTHHPCGAFMVVELLVFLGS